MPRVTERIARATPGLARPAAVAWPSPGHVVRAEATALARLSWPLVIGNFSVVAIQVTDSMMVGRLGSAELGAVGLAAHLSLVVSLVCTGTVEAVTAMVARERGSALPSARAIRATVQHGVLLGLLLCLPLCALLWDSAWVFRITGQAEPVVRIGSAYLRVFLFAIPAMVVHTGLRGFIVGMELSRLALWTSVATVGVNFMGNWVLIYGHLGAPALGARGAALSSVIASLFAVCMLAGISAAAPQLKRQQLWRRLEALDVQRLLAIARLGIPMGLSLLVEIGFFTLIAVLVG